MRKYFHTYWVFTKNTFAHFLEHDSFSHAAAIAFSTIFSLPAILIIALSLASLFFEEQLVQDELLQQFKGLIGNGSAQEIEQIIQNSTRETNSVTAGIIGLATLIFSATTVFVYYQQTIVICHGDELWVCIAGLLARRCPSRDFSKSYLRDPGWNHDLPDNSCQSRCFIIDHYFHFCTTFQGAS
jgi:uncharacterized BrkB/YihY/UPF0761 family membrane protein